MPVAESFREILRWCQANAPATADALRPPATGDDISAAERATTGISWPLPLRELYLQADGSSGGRAFLYVHGYAITLGEVVAEYGALTEFWMSREETDEIRQIARENGNGQAGETAASWLPEFIPLAPDGGGSYLFVDTREGPQRGCVRLWEHVERDGPPIWDSIEAMLDEIANALTDDADLFDEYPTVGEDQRLMWQI